MKGSSKELLNLSKRMRNKSHRESTMRAESERMSDNSLTREKRGTC